MDLMYTFTMLFLLTTLVGCGDNAASAPAAGAAAAPVEAPVEAVKSADDPSAP